jgi:hypothetical protein
MLSGFVLFICTGISGNYSTAKRTKTLVLLVGQSRSMGITDPQRAMRLRT